MITIPRAAAIAAGAVRYFTGEPCLRGHIAQRYVIGRRCVTCIKNERAEKPGGFYLGGSPCLHGHSEGRYRRDGQCVVCCKLHKNNSRLANIEHHRESGRSGYAKNPEIALARVHKWRGKQAGVVGAFNAADIVRIAETQRGLCANLKCERPLSEGRHIDHVMPLFLGGENGPSNIQLLCPDCSFRKSRMHPVEWAKKIGVMS